jgi:hypothetical protein
MRLFSYTSASYSVEQQLIVAPQGSRPARMLVRLFSPTRGKPSIFDLPGVREFAGRHITEKPGDNPAFRFKRPPMALAAIGAAVTRYPGSRLNHKQNQPRQSAKVMRRLFLRIVSPSFRASLSP